nr:reverse transcriptase domain-containing protein [Tanacetum cinerariifolium]
MSLLCFLHKGIRLNSSFLCVTWLSVCTLDRPIGKEGCASWVLRANAHGEVGRCVCVYRRVSMGKGVVLVGKEVREYCLVTNEARANPQLSSGMLAFNLNEPIYSASFTIYSESASGNDASAISITEADPGKSAPSDFVPQQGLKTVLTQSITEKGASSIARQPRFKDLDSPKDDPIIVVDYSDEDEKADEVHATTNSQKHKLELEKNIAEAEFDLLKSQPSFPNAQIKVYKTHEDKEIEKVIALENKFKALDDIVYKTGQSVQTMNMLNQEMVADLRYFNSLEHEVDSLKSQLETQKTQFLNEINRLFKEYYYADHMNAILGVYTELDEITNLQCDYLEALEKIERLETELSKSKTMSKSFEALQKHAINLELALQQCKKQIRNDKGFKENQSNVEREQYFEIQDLKAQLQNKEIAISELKKLIEKIKGKSMETKFEKSSVIHQPNAFKSQRKSILGSKWLRDWQKCGSTKDQPFILLYWSYKDGKVRKKIQLKRDKSEQNRIKTGQKRQAWRSPKESRVVSVDRARKTKENAKRMVKNANTVEKYSFKPSTVHLSQANFPPPSPVLLPHHFNPLIHYPTPSFGLITLPPPPLHLGNPWIPYWLQETTTQMEGPDYTQPEDTKMKDVDHMLEPHTEVAQERKILRPHSLVSQERIHGLSKRYRSVYNSHNNKVPHPCGIVTVFSTYEPNNVEEGQKKVKETTLEVLKDVLSCVDVEERVIVNDKHQEQIVVIGKQLPTSFKRKLQDLMRFNVDIFAWTYADMIGIL